MKIGIIGYGSMGKMLLWRFSSRYGAEDLLVFNRTESKVEEAKDIATVTDNHTLAKESDIIFVCVIPVDIKSVLMWIKDDIRPDSLLVSLNGSITFDMIRSIIDHKTAKVIPSLTAEINRSQTIVCYNDAVTEADKKTLEELLSIIGNVIELPENEVGMGSELVSCMPGFIASMFDVVCNSAQGHTAISKDQIVKMVLDTVSATSDLMLQKDMSFEDVVSRVATKGGITEVGSRVIYDSFPKTADEMFEKTLEKRKITAEKAAEIFSAAE